MISSTIRFFIDFDGTITTDDVVDRILERFAKPEWREVEKEWVAGRIGSRECLARQMALVSASAKDLEKLLGEISLDPGFLSFMATCRERSIPVVITSDGFDLVIRRVLGSLNSFGLFSNRLEAVNGNLKASFSGEPCEHGCANCKVAVIKRFSADGRKSVFVGDGLSDRFAAGAADLVFAKKRLLDFCAEKKIPHQSYSSFKDIEAWTRKNS
ncbi:MAG: MtnX-like HAD-IB family phosphatase [Candidatus Omnitrophica bacterium]|nr:MtnX-like HAD-IB family phosphatase [Candidatus Omnitrophota bacterium]